MSTDVYDDVLEIHIELPSSQTMPQLLFQILNLFS